MENTERNRRRQWILLGLILLVSFLLKLSFAVNVDRLPPRNDERAYLELAAGILQSGEYTSLFRPPGFPAFIALVVKAGGSVETVRVMQTVLSTFTAFLVFLVTRRHLGAGVALAAAGLVAFDPVLIAFSHLLWTETLFLFLFWAMLSCILLPPLPERAHWRWLLAGLFLGAAGLTRAVVLTAAPIVVAWMFWRTTRDQYKTTAAAMGLYALGAFLVVLPWSFRNLQETGDFVLVDTNGAYNMLIGTDPHAMFLDKDDTWSPHWAKLDENSYGEVSQRDPGYAQRRAMRLSIGYVFQNPIRYLGACFFEGAHLWTLDSFPLRHLRNGWYGPHSPPWALPLLSISSAILGMWILAAGALGLLILPAGSLRGMLAIFLLHSVAIHTLLFSLSRFQVPLRPMLAIGAAWLFFHRRELWTALWRSGRPTRRGWVAAAILACFVVVWILEVPLFWDMITNGGAEHRFVRRLDAP